MLEHSIYSVISPEGCASILWRDPSKSLESAEAMKLTAKELLKLGIIDEVIKEPLGGAHRDGNETALAIKKSILKNLKNFEGLSGQDIFDQRKMKFLKIGRDRGFKKSSDMPGKDLSYVEPWLSRALRFVQSRKNIFIATLIMLILIVIFNVLM
jgi:acetyl-CoA carboxylase carboxyl transferase subunit alpha